MRFRFRRKPPPSPRSDGTAELARAKEQRAEMDDLALKHVEVSAKIVERIEANHTAEALGVWYASLHQPDTDEEATRHHLFPWRHA